MANEKWGAQFVCIAIGAPDDPCRDQDAETIANFVTEATGLKTFKLRGRDADRLSFELVNRALLKGA